MEQEKKMTLREFYTAISTADIADELKDYAKTQIEKLDAANEKKRNKPSKKQSENAPVIEAIKGALTNEFKTASVIAAEIGISVQKASGLLRGLVASGEVVSKDVNVPKKGPAKAYAVAAAEEVAESTDAE